MVNGCNAFHLCKVMYPDLRSHRPVNHSPEMSVREIVMIWVRGNTEAQALQGSFSSLGKRFVHALWDNPSGALFHGELQNRLET